MKTANAPPSLNSDTHCPSTSTANWVLYDFAAGNISVAAERDFFRAFKSKTKDRTHDARFYLIGSLRLHRYFAELGKLTACSSP